MVWFYCDDCGESIKKPKLQNHFGRCRASAFTCIDCSRVFDRQSVNSHTQCVTEKEKYVKGATKPGGFAETGFFKDKSGQGQEEIVGEEFLTKGPDFKCTICNIWCNTWDSLVNHSTGSKHIKKTRSARAKKAEAEGNKDGIEKNGKLKPNQLNGAVTTTDSSKEVEIADNDKKQNKKSKKNKGAPKQEESVLSDEKEGKKKSGEVVENEDAEKSQSQKSKKRKKTKDQNYNSADNNQQEQIQNGVKKKKLNKGVGMDSYLMDKIQAALEINNDKQDVKKLFKKLLKDSKEEFANVFVMCLQQDDRFIVEGDLIQLKK